jgi:hypothetical protein
MAAAARPLPEVACSGTGPPRPRRAQGPGTGPPTVASPLFLLLAAVDEGQVAWVIGFRGKGNADDGRPDLWGNRNN